jgi:hypothetical protein
MAVPAFKSTATFVDREATAFTRTAYHNAVSHAAAVTEALTLWEAMSLNSGCILKQYEVAQVIPVSSALPATDVDGEVQGLFTFLNADGKAVQISIPGILAAAKLTGTDRINTTLPDVQEFITAFTGGTVVDSNNIDIVSLKSAVEHFTRKRRSS